MIRSFFLAAALLMGACSAPPAETKGPELQRRTYRVIGGVSMGGIGAAALGSTNAERFDGVASLGGPLDEAFFSRMVDSFLLGGFCSKADLEKALATDPTSLNDPKVMDACGVRQPTVPLEHANTFNHWKATLNGADFNRDKYFKIISDLTLGYGNFFSENPESTYAAYGLDPEAVREMAPDFCSKPTRVKHVYNAEFNPDGTYDAITFCDGEPVQYFCKQNRERVDFCADPKNIVTPLSAPQAQVFADTACATKGGAVLASTSGDELYLLDHWGYRDPCVVASSPQGMLLAYDYNGNGRRDYGEPVANNSRERFDDVGADGCLDAYEDGAGGCLAAPTASATDPNHDNFDIDSNAVGTQGNMLREEGEPFRDFGLDGVPNTSDFGEGNQSFDMSIGRRTLHAYDAAANMRKLDEKARKRIAWLADGGAYDVFNLGLMSKWMMGFLKTILPGSFGSYRDFKEIPGMVDSRRNTFNPWVGPWSTVPRDILTLFGSTNRTDQQRVDGDGDHVGTNAQAIARFATTFNWTAALWPTLERPATPFGSESTSDRQKIKNFFSTKLNAQWEYAIALPPGYSAPSNAQTKYPVVYMLHGYGMAPDSFMGTAVITDAYVTDSDVNFRPMIFVFPNGKCCWVNRTTGAADCRNKDEQDHEVFPGSGWERECNSGTFWVNRKGYTPADSRPYGDAFLELMDHIDQNYRTLPAADVEVR